MQNIPCSWVEVSESTHHRFGHQMQPDWKDQNRETWCGFVFFGKENSKSERDLSRDKICALNFSGEKKSKKKKIFSKTSKFSKKRIFILFFWNFHVFEISYFFENIFFFFENFTKLACWKRPKFKKSYVDFHFFDKLGLNFENTSVRRQNLYAQLLLSSENDQYEVCHWKKTKIDQNMQNPRKIFNFSKKIGKHEKAVQIWAHNSSWAPRTVHLKFACQTSKNLVQNWPKLHESHH